MTPYGAYPERVTIHMAKTMQPNANAPAGDTQDDNVLTRYVTDKINVDFKLDWEVEQSEFANKLSLMVASNDLPDLFTLSSVDFLLFKQLQENNLLADLQPAYDACANDHVKNTLNSYDGKTFEFFRNGDELNGLAGCNYGFNHGMSWIRTDWMEEAGFDKAPTDIAGIEALLTAWKENPPSEDYVGMPLNYKDVAGVYAGNSAAPIFAVFGAYPGAWILDENGNAVWGSTTPQVKEGLAVLADWYQKGLIDEQFATRTDPNTINAMVSSSQTGFLFAGWGLHYGIGADFPKNNPEAKDKLLPFNAPLDAEGNFNTVAPGPTADIVCVNREFEHPEAVIKTINCSFDLWSEFDESAKDIIAPAKDQNVLWTWLMPTGGFNLARFTTIPDCGHYVDSYIEGNGVTDVVPELPQYETQASYALKYAKDSVPQDMNYIEYYTRKVASTLTDAPEVKVILPSFSYVTESMSDLKPNLDTLEQTTFLKIVMGDLPLDAFDKFVEDWYGQGGQTMTDEVNEIING